MAREQKRLAAKFENGSTEIHRTGATLQIVTIGDATRTREVWARFGAGEEYAADGKPVRIAKN